MPLPDKCKRKYSTSNKVITLLDKTRLDKMGADDTSIKQVGLDKLGPIGVCVFAYVCTELEKSIFISSLFAEC